MKFLEVDVLGAGKKLLNIGATKVGEFDYSRMNFHYPDSNMHKEVDGFVFGLMEKVNTYL